MKQMRKKKKLWSAGKEKGSRDSFFCCRVSGGEWVVARWIGLSGRIQVVAVGGD
jgi:hypothetical protein